jgi:cytochrome c oxidase cbb3-type subunit I/II
VPDTQDSAPSLKGVPAPAHAGWQRWLEARPMHFALWTLIAVAIGGLVQLVPMIMAKSNVPTISSVKPYTALELEGRDIYVSEGCYVCHSQMIRPFRAETERYGEYSKAGEFIYDHPFQFGSRRLGPDLHRVGGKYPHIWHYRHMEDPRATSPGSIMPSYHWLLEDQLSTSSTQAKLKAMRTLGVPYTQDEIDNAVPKLKEQAAAIAADLNQAGVNGAEDKQIVALIAYLQRLGTDIKHATASAAPALPPIAETGAQTAEKH